MHTPKYSRDSKSDWDNRKFREKKKLNIYELLIRDREMDRNAIEKFYWL